MTADTIAAIATALGESGVGIVRVSGPEAVEIVARLARTKPPLTEAPSHTAHHAWLHEDGGKPLDEVLITVMRAPRTYTGEDVVEVGVHGGAIPARRVLRAMLREGARLADRGEFTKRAFLNGRLDLSQAEAVADIVAARSERGADVALAALAGKLAQRTEEVEGRLLDLLARLEVNLDFNEDVEAVGREEIARTLDDCRGELDELARRAPWGRRLREGATVVLVGRPNVGKSSLFNALLQDERALVSEVPGTTRDWLEAWIDLEGVPVRLVDTAGLRTTDGALEAEGVRRAMKLEAGADLRVVVLDGAESLHAEDDDVLARTATSARIVVRNKSDLPAGDFERAGGRAVAIRPESLAVSARTGEGVTELRAEIAWRLLDGVGREPADEVVPSERHEDAIRRALASIAVARKSWTEGWTEEMLAGDVRDAATALGEITGRTVSEEVLSRIFSKFCIGK
jgi:tRNA modification GTPase